MLEAPIDNGRVEDIKIFILFFRGDFLNKNYRCNAALSFFMNR